MADWSSLLPEILRQISDKLVAIEDLEAFTWVCKSFRSAAPKEHWRLHPTGTIYRPPWLLLCCQEDEGPIKERGLLSMYKNKRFRMNLPELHGRRCWGSAYGWIVTLGMDLKLHLFNPLTRRRILLPPLNYSKFYIDRALLIKRPPSSYSSSQFDDFLVITTAGLGELRVVRPDTWASVKFGGGIRPGYVFDVASHHGEIYMLANRGALFVCSNFDGPDPPQVANYIAGDEDIAGDESSSTKKYYLVESLEDLLLVVRSWPNRFDDRPRATHCFDVFKLDSENKKWVRIDDLGNRALFVGNCQSIALQSPVELNCQANCIYFNDDNYQKFGNGMSGHDMGVYDYNAKCFHPFYEGADSLSYYSTPTWFIPSI